MKDGEPSAVGAVPVGVLIVGIAPGVSPATRPEKLGELDVGAVVPTLIMSGFGVLAEGVSWLVKDGEPSALGG